jgi:hypothetical protein
MFVAVPTKAMGKTTLQIKDTVIANPYVSASIVVGIVIVSCIYLKKCFFGRSAVVVKSSVQQDVVQQEIVIVPAKEVIRRVQISPIVHPIVREAVEPEQTSPVVILVAGENQGAQIIKVVNDHNQSLNFRGSSVDDNDDVMHQFSVPSYSDGLITIN